MGLDVIELVDKDDAIGLAASLSAGLDPNVTYEGGELLLSRASAKGSEAVVEVLLAHGAIVDPYPCWPSPLVLAVEAGAIGVVEKLLAAGADVGSEPWHEDADLPLLSAVYARYWNIAEILISHGAVEAADDGWFADILKCLLRGGGKSRFAILTALVSRMLTRFEEQALPVPNSYLQKATRILDRKTSTRDLATTLRERINAFQAALDMVGDWAEEMASGTAKPHGLLEVVNQTRLEFKAQVAAAAFCQAVQYTHVSSFGKIAQSILDLGIAVNFSYNNRSPLMEAAFSKQDEFVRKLLVLGADPRAFDIEYYDAVIDFARLSGDTETHAVVEAALRASSKEFDDRADLRLASIEPDQQLEERSRLAVEAAAENRWDRVERLLDEGADVNGRGRGGRTLVMYAAVQGDKERVLWLVERGAQLNVKDSRGVGLSTWAYGADADGAMCHFVESLIPDTEQGRALSLEERLCNIVRSRRDVGHQ